MFCCKFQSVSEVQPLNSSWPPLLLHPLSPQGTETSPQSWEDTKNCLGHIVDNVAKLDIVFGVGMLLQTALGTSFQRSVQLENEAAVPLAARTFGSLFFRMRQLKSLRAEHCDAFPSSSYIVARSCSMTNAADVRRVVEHQREGKACHAQPDKWESGRICRGRIAK